MNVRRLIAVSSSIALLLKSQCRRAVAGRSAGAISP
jgi:hypothetical protein